MKKLKLAYRFTKIMLLLNCACLLSIAFVDNVLAYHINFEYVQHIMSMDTTFKHPMIYWRAVHNPLIYHVCFALIIFLEGFVSLLLWIGGIHLFRNITSEQSHFQAAKLWGLVGLLSAIILYTFVFFTIASQWFASWQSSTWDAKKASLPFIVLLGLTYLIVSKQDEPS